MRPHLCGPMISTMRPRCWLADGSYYVGRADESPNMFDRHASSPPRMGGSKIARGSSRGSTAAVGQLELASRSPYLNRAMLRCIVQGEVLVTSDLASVQRPVLPSAMTDQLNLFESKPALPEGFRYHPDLLDVGEERVMVAEIERLLFKKLEFHGFAARRRVVSFGWQYDFNQVRKAAVIPEFFRPVREKAARFAGLDDRTLEHLLVTEYEPGAPIGWHRDRAIFEDVIGISLLSVCTFRFRRSSGSGWERASLRLAPRSAYLLRGPARNNWEHSIPGVEHLRYSLTFRNFRGQSRT
jgi:alkylated DNA repair dioxygenase AlkB